MPRKFPDLDYSRPIFEKSTKPKYSLQVAHDASKIVWSLSIDQITLAVFRTEFEAKTALLTLMSAFRFADVNYLSNINENDAEDK